jgi:hypothetical protein
VQYRVSGPDVQKVKELAQQLAAKIGAHPLLEVAPLGLIGVVAAMLPSNSPMALSPSWESSR